MSLKIICYSFFGFFLLGNLAEARYCFSGHIKEAMLLNKSRKMLYSKMSYGQTELITESLISQEKHLYRLALLADTLAEPLQWSGVGFYCDDFVSMEEASKRKIIKDDHPPAIRDYVPLDIPNLKSNLSKLINENQFSLARELVLSTLVKLERERRIQCLTRHTLESVARMLMLLPEQEKRANSLAGYSRYLAKLTLKGHIDFLTFSQNLDARAIGSQMQGVPILCADMPVIPYKL